MKAVCTNDSFELKNDRLMRCKYTKFLYRANGCEIFFFDLTISLLTFLLENTKINQVLLSLNDRFFIGNDIYADSFYALLLFKYSV